MRGELFFKTGSLAFPSNFWVADVSSAHTAFSPLFTDRRTGVVEAFHSWLKRFRKWGPRYEKTDRSFLALLHLATGMIAFNKVGWVFTDKSLIQEYSREVS